MRTYQNSKSRVTMSPGFSSQWNSSQPAWNAYTFPRASLHYQSHASYTYCAGHPAVSNDNISAVSRVSWEVEARRSGQFRTPCQQCLCSDGQSGQLVCTKRNTRKYQNESKTCADVEVFCLSRNTCVFVH